MGNRQVWKGHTNWIRALTVLPDGSVVSGSSDKTLRHWDSATGECLGVWRGHTDMVITLTVLPDSSVVSGSSDSTLRHWDSATSECLGVWKGHTNWIRALTVLPDGSVVSGSSDKTLRHWDSTTGECLGVWKGHKDCVWALTILPNGSVVSGSSDKTLRHWDSATGQCLGVWEGHTKSVTALMVLPDGSVVSGSEDKTLRIWRNPGYFLTHQQGIQIWQALKSNTSVASLTITDSQLNKAQLKQLATALAKHPALTTLKLIRCRLTDDLASVLLKSLQSSQCSVKTLVFEEMPLLSLAMKNQLQQAITQRKVVKSQPTQTIQSQTNPPSSMSHSSKKPKKPLDSKKDRGTHYYKRGKHYEKRDNYAKASDYYQRAGGYGHAKACYSLALLLEHNLCPGQGAEDAVFWYKKAARLGHKLAERAYERLTQTPSQPLSSLSNNMSSTEAAPSNITSVPPSNASSVSSQDASSLSNTGKLESPPSVPGTVSSHGHKKSYTPAAPVLNVAGEVKMSVVIPYEKLQLKQKLGSGGFGTVHRARWHHQSVAIKVLHAKTLSKGVMAEFLAEASMMVQLRSIPQVIAFYGITLDPPGLVMEYCGGGSLYQLLHSDASLPWLRRVQIAKSIAKGLGFLHAEGILHRDLKSPNVLLDKHGQAKLGDFGLSRIKTESRTLKTKEERVGTLYWMAPELFGRHARYTLACDIYSLGMIFWELSSRALPFPDARGNETLVMNWVIQGEREVIPSETPSGFKQLIEGCWSQQPASRPAIAEIIQRLKAIKKALLKTKVETHSPPESGVTTGYVGISQGDSSNNPMMGNTEAATGYLGMSRASVSRRDTYPPPQPSYYGSGHRSGATNTSRFFATAASRNDSSSDDDGFESLSSTNNTGYGMNTHG